MHLRFGSSIILRRRASVSKHALYDNPKCRVETTTPVMAKPSFMYRPSRFPLNLTGLPL